MTPSPFQYQQPNHPYAPTNQPQGIGQYTSGINAGPLPQATLTAASRRMFAPLAPQATQGAFGGQLAGLVGGANNAANINMLRAAAPAQANLQLGEQTANANAGLANMGLLSRLQQDQFAAQSPARNLLWQLLGGAMGGF